MHEGVYWYIILAVSKRKPKDGISVEFLPVVDMIPRRTLSNTAQQITGL
jgi:hypothetical protein